MAAEEGVDDGAAVPEEDFEADEPAEADETDFEALAEEAEEADDEVDPAPPARRMFMAQFPPHRSEESPAQL